MKEIRLQRSPTINMRLKEAWQGSEWLPDTEKARRDLTGLMLIGIAKFGPDSHWLEEREAVPAPWDGRTERRKK